MTTTHQIDGEQERLWNDTAGRAWVEMQPVLDQMFRPFEDLLVETALAGPGGRVLDVGCGTGSTTLAIARWLGARGCCTGIDISEPMLAAARARAERDGSAASFIRADAQTHVFEPRGFDMIVSRFGVMFFSDPVQAFANLRHAATDNAWLRFVAWRRAEENPFMTTAERAAAPLMPAIPARKRDAPGQFAFADRDRLCRILENSGWAEVDIQPLDVACAFPEKELVPYFSRLGPLGLALRQVDELTSTKVIETVRAAFAPYARETEIRFTAACWLVGAQAPVRRS